MAKTRYQPKYQSKGFAQRRKRRTWTGAVAGVVSVLAWAFVLSRLSFLPGLMIYQIDVYGVEQLLVPRLQAAVVQALGGSYAGMFSRSNSLIYPRIAIETALAGTSPQIAQVSVKRSGMHTLEVTVSEKAPEAIICADLPDLTESELTLTDNCYFADQAGYIFKRALVGQDVVRYYMPELTGKQVLGTYATTTEKFATIRTLMADLNTAGISTNSILIGENGDYEIYAHNPAADSIVVIHMDDAAGLATERDNLIAYWNRMISDGRAKGRIPEWAEIKLQFPPNVYSRQVEQTESEN